MAIQASPDASPTDSELEKGGLEKESQDERREDIEEPDDGTLTEPRAIRKAGSGEQSLRLHPQLQQTRSRSSARSGRSYTDGYTHFEHEDASKPDDVARGPGEEDKEFEVQFNGDADPWNPKNKTTLRKWCIVLIGCACSLCVTCASALYTSTYDQMEKEFNINREVATVGLTTYVCGLGLGPMFLSPLSEFYGRRNIYICAFGMFFIWLIPCAVAPDIGSMLFFRESPMVLEICPRRTLILDCERFHRWAGR